MNIGDRVRELISGACGEVTSVDHYLALFYVRFDDGSAGSFFFRNRGVSWQLLTQSHGNLAAIGALVGRYVIGRRTLEGVRTDWHNELCAAGGDEYSMGLIEAYDRCLRDTEGL